MKKKLLIVNPQQFGYGAGYYYYCKYLKNYFEIDFICFDRKWGKVKLDGINIIYKKFERNKLLRLISFLIFIIKITYKKDYDVLFMKEQWLACIIGLFTKIEKKILDIRTGSLHNNKTFRKVFNNLTWLNTLFFDHITVLSDNLRTSLHINVKKSTILPLGAEEYSKTIKSFNKMNLLYIGVFHNRDLEKTIYGFAKFYNMYNKVIQMRYDIIGYDKREDELKLEKAVYNVNMQNIVLMHGRKNHFEIGPYFDESNIGVCFIPQAEYYQVQPSTKIFEYALSGLYTIATNTLENKKYITKDNGIICEDNVDSFYDSLVQIYNIRNEINMCAIKNSLKDYHWETIVNKHLLPILK